MKLICSFDTLMAKGLIFCIRVYQKTLSFDHAWFGKYFPSRGCRFYPSCSQYGIETLQCKGFAKGFWFVLWRFLRCNPWSKGGIDKPCCK